MNYNKIVLPGGNGYLGNVPELILKSRWVIPKKLLDAGFKFEFSKAEKAVEAIYKNK